MTSLLMLAVDENDGVCTCTSGAAHLHLTTEANVRDNAVIDALHALADQQAEAMRQEALGGRTTARYLGDPTFRRCEETTDVGAGRARCTGRYGHFMAHTYA